MDAFCCHRKLALALKMNVLLVIVLVCYVVLFFSYSLLSYSYYQLLRCSSVCFCTMTVFMPKNIIMSNKSQK